MLKNFKKAFSLIELSIVILIIGILVAGVTQSSRLVKAIKISTAKQITNSSPVSSIKNLSLWLETVSDSSFLPNETSNDSFISLWNDINPQSTLKINATQTNNSFQPKYFDSEINGLPGVRFDGNSDWMTLGVNIGMESNSKITLFVVNKFFTNTANFIIAKRDNFVDGKGWNLVMWGGTLAFELMGHQSSNLITIATGVSFNSTYISTVVYDGGLNSAGLNMWINGQKLASPSRGSSGANGSFSMIPSPNGDEDLRIGAREGNGFAWYHGSIGEIIIFQDKLSDADVNAVNDYLKKKWSIK